MRYTQRSNRRFPFYLIAILIGMGGILFSRQFEDSGIRLLVVLASIAIPVFSSGNMLARPSMGRLERMLLIAQEVMSPLTARLSRTLGMVSLMTGLLAVLYSVLQTGEDIEEMGAHFWHLAEHINEGFILSSSEGQILLVNRRLLDLFGKREEDVLGKETTVLAGEFQMDAVRQHFKKRSEGIASEYELSCVIRGEPRRLLISGSPLFDQHGKHTGTLGLVRDVTEQYNMAQRLEQYNRGLKQLVEEQTQRLRASETRFRQLLVSMNEGFLTLDEHYRIRFANTRIAELLRLTQELLIGREIFEFIDATGRVHLLNIFAQGEALGHADLRRELNLVDHRGALVPVVVSVSYLSGQEEETRFSLVVTNVSALKRMQNQLEQRARELEKVNEQLLMHDRAKDSFLSNVSHELRTPLSTIKGYLEMLESGGLGEVDASQRSALTVMHRNVDRLVAQINEIIEFSRMEIRGVQLSMGLFLPHELIQEAVASAHPAAVPKDISINVFLEEKVPPAWGDMDKLGQVLGILLNNAVKFSNPGGMIQVRLERHEGRDLALVVADTGIGIPPRYHDQIFAKFFQVDASRSRRYGGTGIGLSIARSIVEAHGGHIELESTPGQGSTFTVILPDICFDGEYPGKATSGFDRLQAVVISTNTPFREHLVALLMECGCAVTGHAQHFEGARAAIERRADVVILNDSAEDESGEATVESIRSAVGEVDIPIIVCCEPDSERMLQVAELQAEVHVLPKPFNAARLIGCIRMTCFDEMEDFQEASRKESSPLTSDSARVLVIDQDPDFLAWIELALTRRGIACRCATDLSRVAEVVDDDPVALVLLDGDTPETRLEQRLEMLREALPKRPGQLYVMTGLPGFSAREPGVTGILRKPFTVDSVIGLLDAGRRQAQGSSMV
jgi:PAS domain S-box-containing protein